MTGSNLQSFFESDEIVSSEDYFRSSTFSIQKLIDEQNVHANRALKCIIEIGNTLSELQDYKKRIKSPKVEKLWNALLKKFDFSPSTVSKYIKISNNPVLTDKRFIGRIPPSVYSLYELSKLEPVALQLLIESEEVNLNSGRTVIAGLVNSPKTKKSKKDTTQLMTLTIPKENWVVEYKKLEPKLLNFLDSLGITYELSRQVQYLENAEVTRMKKVERFAFKQSKIFFKELVHQYINEKCRQQNICPPNTPFKKKCKLLKFATEEVTTVGCINDGEVLERLVFLGLIDNIEWNQHYTNWLSDGFEKYPSQLPDNLDVPIDVNQFESINKSFHTREKKRDFSKLKV